MTDLSALLVRDLADREGGATGRCRDAAPEMSGEIHLRDAEGLAPGDIVPALVEDADAHDLFGAPLR